MRIKPHTTDQKKDYDDLISVVFDGQLNNNGHHNGNALFHQYQEWTVSYSNRKMKSLCNGVIDYFADDSNICEIEELRGLAKKLKEERNAALAERTTRLENKKRVAREGKVEKEQIEQALGFRSRGKGANLGLCASNLSEDELSGIFDGLGELGNATASRSTFECLYCHKITKTELLCLFFDLHRSFNGIF